MAARRTLDAEIGVQIPAGQPISTFLLLWQQSPPFVCEWVFWSKLLYCTLLCWLNALRNNTNKLVALIWYMHFLLTTPHCVVSVSELDRRFSQHKKKNPSILQYRCNIFDAEVVSQSKLYKSNSPSFHSGYQVVIICLWKTRGWKGWNIVEVERFMALGFWGPWYFMYNKLLILEHLLLA